MRLMKQSPTIMWLTSIALVGSVLSSPLHSLAGSVPQRQAKHEAAQMAVHPALSSFAVDLTGLARQGRLEANTGHTVELNRVVKILSENAWRNPLLIGDAGEGNAAEVAGIARGLAQRIADGKVPVSLEGKQVFSLKLDKLAAGAKDSDEFIARLQLVLSEAAAANGQILLFVDQLHQFAGNYARQQASLAIRQALESHQFQMIGAATSEAYASYIAADASVAKLFQTVPMGEQANNGAVKTQSAETREERGFVGEVISSDLREVMKAAKSKDDRVDVILQTPDVRNAQLANLLKQNTVMVGDYMPELNSMKVRVPVKAIEKLAKSGLADFMSSNVKLQSLGHVSATTGTDLIRTQTNASLLGVPTSTTTFDGTNIGIAIIDSGVDRGHAAFGSRVKFNLDFTTENQPDIDPYGHGTHVAAAAAGISTKSGNAYQGIAPNANLIVLRVLNWQGSGSSAVLLKALNWFLAPADPTKPVSSTNPLNKDKYSIRVVNMSLGTPAINSYRNDPLCRAARALVDAGMVVVAAAGNNGKDANGTKLYGQIHSPGNEPSVITVGAVNTFGTDVRSDDGIASYSSRGPTRSNYVAANGVRRFDNIIKPEIVAPGNRLIFAESDSGGSTLLLGIDLTASNYNLLVTQHPELDSGLTDNNNKRLMYLSGTSMATPLVAGAAALLLQANPKLTPNMVKALLMYTAQPLRGFNMLEQGAGELNVEGAMRVAKLVRTDLTNSTATGANFLTTTTVPNQQTTIAGQTFTWSRGLMTKYGYLTGTNLIMKYQPIYGTGIVMGDADVAGDGIMVSDGIMVGDGIVMGDGIMVSDGIVMGDGVMFLPGGQLAGDGIMVSDGIMVGDGIVMGDGIMVGDGIVMGDAALQAMSSRALIGGDASPCMH